MPKLTILVHEKYLREGVKRNSHACAVYLAAREALDRRQHQHVLVSVSAGQIGFARQVFDENSLWIPFPDDVREKVSEWDKGHEVKQFAFDVDVSWDVLDPIEVTA